MPEFNSGDTAFVFVSSALVLLMTPGLALFYAGMVRSKNVLSTTMHSLVAMGIVTATWVVLGYSIAFGPDVAGVVGGFEHALLAGVTAGAYGASGHQIPLLLFALYQGMFAIITAALISGAVAERMRFSAYVIFIAMWSLLVYAPLAHWVWGGGWLQQLGVLDFAGGAVVHISSAAAALAAAIAVGARKGFGTDNIAPHNLPMTILGLGLLWFGWLGFNGGSALAATPLAISATSATHVAAAFGMIGWIVVEWWRRGRPTTLGAASGAVAGLGTITAASGFVDTAPALLIGLVAGAVCYYGVQLKDRLGFDDSLDVVGVHGVGGTLGMLATGVFAGVATNPDYTGLLAGNASQLGVQALAVVVSWGFSFGLSLAILKVIDRVVGLRVDEDTELQGLDVNEHAEVGYAL